RTARGGGAAGPDELLSRLDVRREQLVLEVAGRYADALHELDQLLRFRHSPPERLLTRDSLQLALSALHRGDDLLHVGKARLIGPAEPDRFDGGVGHHLANGLVRLRVADADIPRELRRRRGIRWVRAPHAEHIGVTHAAPALDVEARVESRADKSYTKPFRHRLQLEESDLSLHGRDELCGVVADSLLEHDLDVLEVGNARGRIAVQHDEIGLLAGGDRSDLVRPAEERRAVER